MHYLQKHILDKLRFGQPLTYTDMLPDNMVSSQFQYHLKSLITEGLVQKGTGGKYSLTHAGEAAVEYLSVNRATPVLMPKVISHTLLTHNDSLLLLRKQKEPYRHLIEPIAGKIHFGEEIAAAAQREVFEKTGLSINKPVLCGVANMLICKNGKPLTHMITYAHRADLERLPSPLPKDCVVVKNAELTRTTDLVPGAQKLIQAVLGDARPFVIDIRADC